MQFPKGHFVFLDLETTGGKASADRITEVALIEVFDGEVIDQYQTLVNPEVPISQFITNLTGIDDAMVADAPVFADIAEDLLSRLLDKTLVAHNARFDHSFLKNEFRRLGFDYRTKVLCTVKLSRALMPELGKHSLDNLIHVHGLFVEARHRAMGDADLLVQLVSKWTKIFDVESLQKILQLQLKTASLPPHINQTEVDGLPINAGVYLFYDEKDTLLYVGKSVNIRDRVKSHFTNDHLSDKELEMSVQIRRIESRICAGDFGAQLMEAKLIKELRPIYNRQLRKTQSPWYFEFSENKLGYLNVAVKSSKIISLEKLPSIVGIFRSKKMATETLRKIVDDYALCHRFTGLEKSRSGPCFAHQLHKCLGPCANKESTEKYNARVRSALDAWKLELWPHQGSVIVKENVQNDVEDKKSCDQFHLIYQWCHLASASSLAEMKALQSEYANNAELKKLSFEYDTYKILSKFLVSPSSNLSIVTQQM